MDCSSDIYGNLYLVGTTASTGMATPGSYQLNYGVGLSHAFVAQYNGQGQMVWRSYFGGSAADEGSAMVADEIGNIYFGGQTASTGLSINNPFQAALAGGTDVYFAKFTVEGAPQWITYYGGAGNEELAYLSVDQSQKILFAGSAASTMLSSNGWQASLNGGQDGWFGKIEDCPNPYVTIALDGEIEFCEGESVMMLWRCLCPRCNSMRQPKLKPRKDYSVFSKKLMTNSNRCCSTASSSGLGFKLSISCRIRLKLGW